MKNKQRLYIIATAVFTAAFLPLAISWIIKWVYLPQAGNYVFPDTTGEPDFLWLAPGFLLFLFAQAFKRGLELQEEHDLTV